MPERILIIEDEEDLIGTGVRSFERRLRTHWCHEWH